jgi:hypothetical protein
MPIYGPSRRVAIAAGPSWQNPRSPSLGDQGLLGPFTPLGTPPFGQRPQPQRRLMRHLGIASTPCATRQTITHRNGHCKGSAPPTGGRDLAAWLALGLVLPAPAPPGTWQAEGGAGRHRDYLAGMSLPPDQPTSPSKPKLSAEERRARQADRLTTIRLRMAIHRALDERDITTPAAIGEALGMPAAEATKLLTRRQWREGDVAALQAAAARLGLQVPGID